jgi:LysM repeat protein
MKLLRQVPGRPGIYAYVVRRGDVYERIAHWFGVSVASMRRLNPRVSPQRIHAGQVLLLPRPTR